MKINQQASMDAQVQNCLSIEDDNQAFACLLQTVKDAKGVEGVCRPKIVIFTKEGCSPCAEEKEFRKEAIAEGLIEEISLNTLEGAAIAASNSIEATPAVVLLDCNNKIIEPTGQ